MIKPFHALVTHPNCFYCLDLYEMYNKYKIWLICREGGNTAATSFLVTNQKSSNLLSESYQQAVVRFLQPIKQQPSAFYIRSQSATAAQIYNNEPESQADHKQSTSGLWGKYLCI